jgi:hypothetical protein
VTLRSLPAGELKRGGALIENGAFPPNSIHPHSRKMSQSLSLTRAQGCNLCIEDFPAEVRATGECSACGTWGVYCLVASHPRSSPGNTLSRVIWEIIPRSMLSTCFIPMICFLSFNII